MKLDDERFIDMKDRNNIVQRRYDDKNKIRKVKREEQQINNNNNNNNTKNKNDSKSESDSEEEDFVQWYWAGDSKKGGIDRSIFRLISKI